MNDMMTFPETFERKQWLIDLMAAPSDALEGTFDKAETLDELMERYANCPVEPIADKILRLEKLMLEQPQSDYQLRHYILNGVYYRENTIPAGTLITGYVYKDEHTHFLLRGSMTLLSAATGAVYIKAPCTFIGDKGVKRLAYMHEETVWAGVARTDETDPDKAFENLVVPQGGLT